MKTFLIIIAILILVWIAYGYFASQSKEPKYTVLEKKDGYEIREYAPYIEARVTVSGTYREAMSSGFRILAGYIFGDNTTNQSISMTTPVTERQSESIAMTAPVTVRQSESIAMTAPVSETVTENNDRVVAFVMPEEYTLNTLPTPNDKRIEIVEVQAHKSAVVRYSGYNNPEKVVKMKARLLEYLKRDGVIVVGTPRGAGYNPPSTPPFMRRNEVLVDVE